MELTKEALMAGTGCTSELADIWLEPLKKACAEFDIDSTAHRLAAFVSLIGDASESLSCLVENTNFTAEELCRMWPFRFAIDPHVAFLTPNSVAYYVGGDPVKVANIAYANRLGNGPERTGDGWKYRGRGPLRVTGRAAYTACLRACKLAPDTDPAALEDPVVGARAAAWVFKGTVLESTGARYTEAVTALAQIPVLLKRTAK
jgi:putative chitinase